MCNRYDPPSKQALRDRFRVEPPEGEYAGSIGPLQRGPYLTSREALIGQWGLIPDSSPTKRPTTRNRKPLSTNNARRESVATAASFARPWAQGQRCLVPADAYYEPCWETGRSVLWRFNRADGHPWALAGLWNDWTDPETGEIVHSYTMLTQNCDGHSLLARMHKPELDSVTKLPLAEQDKRSVVPIEERDWDAWLNGSVQDAEGLIQVPPMELFVAGPVEAQRQTSLL